VLLYCFLDDRGRRSENVPAGSSSNRTGNPGLGKLVNLCRMYVVLGATYEVIASLYDSGVAVCARTALHT